MAYNQAACCNPKGQLSAPYFTLQHIFFPNSLFSTIWVTYTQVANNHEIPKPAWASNPWQTHSQKMLCFTTIKSSAKILPGLRFHFGNILVLWHRVIPTNMISTPSQGQEENCSEPTTPESIRENRDETPPSSSSLRLLEDPEVSDFISKASDLRIL